MVRSAPQDAASLAATVKEFREAGAEQLAFLPTGSGVDRLERLLAGLTPGGLRPGHQRPPRETHHISATWLKPP
ncbi:hypothetical protein WJ438_06390 [Streptomyces sp. GD-15H]|uniref:hypothetical protein n=1 Tax=Streptomyces sp. GD-15H TaxID=3129112 RepID=UPI0032467F77